MNKFNNKTKCFNYKKIKMINLKLIKEQLKMVNLLKHKIIFNNISNKKTTQLNIKVKNNLIFLWIFKIKI